MDDFSKTAEKNHTRLMMTEAYATLKQQLQWYGNETSRGSHMPFNFALISDLNKDSKADDFKVAIDGWLDEMPTFARANWVLGNHDRSRIGYRYGEERHESLAIMTMTLPGLNVVYYGEEILMTDNRDITWEQTEDPAACNTNSSVFQEFTRDPVRTPFQWDETENAGFSDSKNGTWLPIHKDYKTTNLKAEKAAEKSTFKLYQELIKYRQNDVLAIGGYESKAISSDLFAYQRTLKGHNTVVVFINLGNAKTVNLRDLLDEEDISDKTKVKVIITNNNSKLYDMKGKDVDDFEKIELGNFDAVILEVSSATKFTISILLIACSLFKFLF